MAHATNSHHACAIHAGRRDSCPPGRDRCPRNRPVPPGHHALTHATVVTKPGVKIEDATVVIHNGRIVSVTKTGEAPDTARIWDMSGMTLYAGFIDPYVTDAKPLSTTMTQSITGMEATAAGKPGFFGTTGNERDPGQTGPGSGLSTMKPDFHVADNFSPKRDTYDEYRKQGFTAVALTPSSGIVRGQSALISLGQGSPNETHHQAEPFSAYRVLIHRQPSRRNFPIY